MSTTVAKALGLIEILSEREEPWSISDLAQRVGLPKSNVHFLLSALCSKGYVERHERSVTVRLLGDSRRVARDGEVADSPAEIRFAVRRAALTVYRGAPRG